MQPRDKLRAARRTAHNRRPRPARAAATKADEVPVLFTGKPAVLLATGPSLCREDIEYIRPLHARGEICVLGLNDAYRLCDFLDVLYFCDPKWLDCNPAVLDFDCAQIWTQDAKVRERYPTKIRRVAGSGGAGLSEKEHHIHFGGNSGFQLINLAWHMGCREMYLLGYNMGATDGSRRKQHFFGHHPKGLNQSNNYKGFTSSFASLKQGIKNTIINCTEPSNLSPQVFRFKPLREALPHNEKIRHIQSEPVDAEEARTRQAAAIFETAPKVRRPPEHGKPDSGDHRDRTIPVATATRHNTRSTYGGRR
jgi:hypothetical protein